MVALAAIAVVMWCAAIGFLQERRADAKRVTEEVLLSAASTFKEHALQTFNAAELSLKLVAEMVEHASPQAAADPAELTRRLKMVEQAAPFLSRIKLVGLDGRVIADSEVGTGDVDGGTLYRLHVRAVLSDPDRSIHIGAPIRHDAAGQPAIPVSVVWRKEDGSLKGVVTGLVRPAYFESFYARSMFARKLVIVLRQHGGVLIVSLSGTGAGWRLSGADPFDKAPSWPAARPVGPHSSSDGKTYLMATAADDDPPITIFVGESVEFIYARWNITAAVVLGLAASISVLLVFSAAVIRRKLRLRDELDAALRAASEERNQLADSKFQFLAQVGHELRTPLNAIIGFSGMIGGEYLGPIGNSRYREYACDIEHSGRYLLGIVSDLLDLAKLDAGKFVLRETKFPIGEALDTVRVLMAAQAQKGNIALTIEDASSGCRLRGDLQIVKQMLVNLVSNAVKFTPEFGEVSIAALLDPRGSLVVLVRDTGIGISMDDIPRILMPYEQSVSGLDRGQRDTGLGLALTNKFAELHGARLEIDSALGVGTTISITFPRERVQAFTGCEPEKGASEASSEAAPILAAPGAAMAI